MEILYKIGIVIVLSIISAILYRLGGQGKPFNTRYRDVGCSLVTLVALWLLLGFILSYWWAYLLTFGLSWGALSAYWGLDEKRWGYWAHGLGLSLAILPIVFVTGHWIGFILRTIILTGFITIWSELVSKDKIEERGRGFAIIVTTLLLLI